MRTKEEGWGRRGEKRKWAGLEVAEGADPGSWGEGAGWEERERGRQKWSRRGQSGRLSFEFSGDGSGAKDGRRGQEK